MVDLDTKLSGVLGERSSKALNLSFDMVTVGDLLRHYPRRLADRGELTSFADLRVGEHVTVLAKTRSVRASSYRPRTGGRPATRTEVTVTDGSQDLLLTFFRQPWKSGQLEAGTVAWFSGKVGEYRGRRQLQQPTFEVLGRGADLADFESEDVQRWWPVYPATSKVTSGRIGDCVRQVLLVLDDIGDPLPADVRERQGLLDFPSAVRQVHQPADRDEWSAARSRLRFDEAFLLQVVLARRRAAARSLPATPRHGRADGLLHRFDSLLPFTLTAGQREVGAQVCADLGTRHPMQRLLQGEVGSGKTVVAVRAMLQVVDSGGQAALLAPTEVLAAQHHRSIQQLLGPLGSGGMLGGDPDATRVALLTGSMGAARRRQALLDAASGAAGIVIGTHALLEEKVSFAELGFVVVDEQHRFGVEQRAALTGKAGPRPPHVLVMTATPIPRTVAMTVFGDLDVSTLRELPVGRAPIQTTVVAAAEQPGWLGRAWQRVREEVQGGHQAYVVCPRIGADADPSPEETPNDEDAETDDVPRRPPLSVTDLAVELAAGPLDGLRVAVLHGRLPPEQKDDVMRRFADGALDVLVATTVIEVGVDVPNASVMVVMDADRFGVSQLHQLRGRVGRGTVPGLCLLVTEAAEGSRARERVDGVAASTDGFALSRLDLKNRREGDVLGSAQSGRRSSLRLLSVLRDEGTIVAARDAAEELVTQDPDLGGHPQLAATVAELAATDRAGYLEKS